LEANVGGSTRLVVGNNNAFVSCSPFVGVWDLGELPTGRTVELQTDVGSMVAEVEDLFGKTLVGRCGIVEAQTGVDWQSCGVRLVTGLEVEVRGQNFGIPFGATMRFTSSTKRWRVEERIFSRASGEGFRCGAPDGKFGIASGVALQIGFPVVRNFGIAFGVAMQSGTRSGRN
jgi:hypothetical protein